MGTNVAERKSVRHTISCPFFSFWGPYQELSRNKKKKKKKTVWKEHNLRFLKRDAGGYWHSLGLCQSLLGENIRVRERSDDEDINPGIVFFTLAALLIRSCSIKWKEICNEKGWWVKGLLVRVLSVSVRVARLRQHMQEGKKRPPW